MFGPNSMWTGRVHPSCGFEEGCPTAGSTSRAVFPAKDWMMRVTIVCMDNVLVAVRPRRTGATTRAYIDTRCGWFFEATPWKTVFEEVCAVSPRKQRQGAARTRAGTLPTVPAIAASRMESAIVTLVSAGRAPAVDRGGRVRGARGGPKSSLLGSE